MERIKAWSFSGLLDYEACPLRARFRYIDKIKTEDHPAAARGTAIHDMAEQYVKGTLDPLPKELKKFEEQFLEWRGAYAAGLAIAEDDWGVTHDLEPCGFFDENVWWRGKLDLLVKYPEQKHAWVGDHKTGKEYPVKHMQQGQLYSWITFIMFPEIETVTAQMVYLDQGKLSRPATFNRIQAAKFGARFMERAEVMTSDTTFRAKPNKYNCQYCGYREHCDVAAY